MSKDTKEQQLLIDAVKAVLLVLTHSRLAGGYISNPTRSLGDLERSFGTLGSEANNIVNKHMNKVIEEWKGIIE